MDALYYARDIALVSSQVAPLLVVAFVVEVRSLGERRPIGGADARWLVFLAFGSLASVLITGAFVINGDGGVSGPWALAAWAFTGVPIVLLVTLVGIAAATGLAVAAEDLEAETKEAEVLRRHYREPGWKWFVRGRSERVE